MKKRIPALFCLLLSVFLTGFLYSCGQEESSTPLSFTDSGVADCVARALGKEEALLTSADVGDIVYLFLSDTAFSLGYRAEEEGDLYGATRECAVTAEIGDLSDLSLFPNLKYLVLSGAFYLEDLAFVKGMDALTHLYISMSSLSSLAGIEEAAALESLTVNQSLLLSDFDRVDLGKLKKLSKLDLSENLCEELPDLSGCDSLVYLALDANRITDLSRIGGCTSLRILTVSQNRISDLSSLSGMDGLVLLYASENEISDLKPLASLSALEALDLDANQIDDLSPLTGCENLKTLMVVNNPVKEIAFLLERGVEVISE